MRREEKCKRKYDSASNDPSSCDSDDSLRRDENYIRKSKKHKKCRNETNENYSRSNHERKESCVRGSEKVIQLYGSSSDEELNQGHKNFERERHLIDRKNKSHNKYENYKLQDKKIRDKKYRYRSESPNELEYNSKKEKHHSVRKFKKKRDSSFENKLVDYSDKSRSSSRHSHVKKDAKRQHENSLERSNEFERVKIKKESISIKSEPVDDDRRNVRNATKDEFNSNHHASDRRNNSQEDNHKSKTHEWGTDGKKEKKTGKDKDVKKPNYNLSGKLAEETNIFNGVVIKYSEPPEARMPKKRWRLYPFKGDQGLPTLYIHRQSAYLMGRDRKIVDIPIDHPSCSKQHAALQYRLVSYNRSDGSLGKQIKLYIIDLESANGTFINNNKIEPKKYVELFEKDVIKFGYSSREYVLLHEHSKDDDDKDED